VISYMWIEIQDVAEMIADFENCRDRGAFCLFSLHSSETKPLGGNSFPLTFYLEANYSLT